MSGEGQQDHNLEALPNVELLALYRLTRRNWRENELRAEILRRMAELVQAREQIADLEDVLKRANADLARAGSSMAYLKQQLAEARAQGMREAAEIAESPELWKKLVKPDAGISNLTVAGCAIAVVIRKRGAEAQKAKP